MRNDPLKIVYCTPSLYIPGGVERVLTLKANYFVEHFGYDITIILTDGKDKPNAFPLSPKINVLNLDINFEELWGCSFIMKILLYLKKQRSYKRRLTKELLRIRPDITDSLLRREINFITKIPDGSKKIGELHVSKYNFRTFKDNETNFVKEIFSWFWRKSNLRCLKRLDKFIVLTAEDKKLWNELNNVIAIPNPISFQIPRISDLNNKRVLAVGRYDYVKGYDMLLKAWAIVEKDCLDWSLVIFGAGNREPYEILIKKLHIDSNRCHICGSTENIQEEYIKSTVFVVSSRYEGLSMAMLEAMSCGLPVVSFACPCGPKDLICNGENGILVPRENVEKLAESLKCLMNSPQDIQRMGKKALMRTNDYKIDVIAHKWKSLFEALLLCDNN